MPKKNSYISISDQFCGAGGSSQGAKRALAKYGIGEEGIKLAMNHWKLAIETHNTNFPKTLHDCTDISACDPRRYPSTDVLITSPECTKQSPADGKKKPSKQSTLFEIQSIKPEDERSRATMWDVCRFAEYHRYNNIIVENVVEAKKWIMFESWLNAMSVLGYSHKCCYLNSMHFHPCPQSRDRMYVVFWRKGNNAPKLNHTPLAFCPKCDKDVSAVQGFKRDQKTFKYKTGYVYCCPVHGSIVDPYYYAAFNCIDWSSPGRKIGDINLCPNTIRRIKSGRERFWNESMPLHEYPLIVKGEYTKAEGYVRQASQALQTQSTRQTFGLLTPMIIEYNSTGKAIPISKPITTFTASAAKHGVLMPYMVENKGKSTARAIVDSISTITSMPQHGYVTTDAFNSFLSYYNGGSDMASHILDAANTFTGSDRVAILSNQVPDLEDCYYRTLRAHEVKVGMAFDKEYIVLGNSKDQVKQCGNAVTPPVMEWLVERVIESLN